MYPAVPMNRNLVRFSITAANTEEEVDQAIQALEAVWEKLTAAGNGAKLEAPRPSKAFASAVGCEYETNRVARRRQRKHPGDRCIDRHWPCVRFGSPSSGTRRLPACGTSADGEAIRRPVRSGHIEPVLLDVTSPESIDGALLAVGDEPLAGLVNNAGIAIAGPLELLSIEAWRKQFEVNVIGLVAVTQAFLPLLRRGRGRIVNIGSIAGRSALPGSGAYDSSKFAVEAITDVLRMELHSWGISVSVIEAGAVATPIWEKSLREADDLSRQVAPERYALYRGLMATVREEDDQIGAHRDARGRRRQSRGARHDGPQTQDTLSGRVGRLAMADAQLLARPMERPCDPERRSTNDPRLT